MSFRKVSVVGGAAIAVLVLILWVSGLAFGSPEPADQSVVVPPVSTSPASVVGQTTTSQGSAGQPSTGQTPTGQTQSGGVAPVVNTGSAGDTGANASALRVPVDFGLGVRQTQAPRTSVLLNAKVQVFLNAQLTNRGYADAHNSKVYVRARVGDSYIAIDGKNALAVDLGTVAAGKTVQRDITFELQMSLAQGNQAQREGIVFEITIGSDERTQALAPWRCTSAGCATL